MEKEHFIETGSKGFGMPDGLAGNFRKRTFVFLLSILVQLLHRASYHLAAQGKTDKPTERRR
jgi:hypothetical protein